MQTCEGQCYLYDRHARPQNSDSKLRCQAGPEQQYSTAGTLVRPDCRIDVHMSYINVGWQIPSTMAAKLKHLDEIRYTHTRKRHTSEWRHAETISSGFSAAIL